MSADYKPGTVAMVTNGDEQLLAFRVSWPAEDWMSVDDGSLHAVSEVRPLVVLDPDDREQMDVLCKALVEAAYAHGNKPVAHNGIHPDTLVDALRSLSRPPKPPEPQGLGAVVEDTEGRHYVRHCPGDCEDGGLCIPWRRVTDALNRTYDEFDVARVLSDGWEPKP